MKDNAQRSASRRHFLGTLATGAATMGLSTLAPPLPASAKSISEHLNHPDDPDAWFSKIKGKHRIVFDVTKPNDILPFAWPRVFLLTNESTGTPAKDNNVVVVLRHESIPYAMEDRLWAKYKFGEVFKINDPATKTPLVRNPFWKPKPGEFKVPGIGEVAIGINELQDSGVMFCVCNVALTVSSATIAQGINANAADVLADFKAGLLPGVELMPSGIWAVGRAQEHGCAYCFAG